MNIVKKNVPVLYNEWYANVKILSNISDLKHQDISNGIIDLIPCKDVM